MSDKDGSGSVEQESRLIVEGQDHSPWSARFESIGCHLPEKILYTSELLASMKHRTKIDLERLTGIHQRHVCESGEDSFTLAVSAAKDCLKRSKYDAAQMEMVISCSISKFKGNMENQFEPSLAHSICSSIGANNAISYDIGNACAGMLTGVFILNEFIRSGEIQRGMVVSGEYISNLSTNAAKQVRSIFSKQLASLTLGDAGAAVIMERAEPGKGIPVVGFTTLSEHSRLCLGFPSKVGPGAVMYTKARTIHKVAIDDSPPLLKEALEASGVDFDEIDYVIPHQTSARAIEKGTQEIAEKFGLSPKHVVVTVNEFGNTASTTHFVALHKFLKEGRFKLGDKIMLISFASGLEVGVTIFTMDELIESFRPEASS